MEDEDLETSKGFDWTELFDAMVKRSEAEKRTAARRQAELLHTRALELARPLAATDREEGEHYLLFEVGPERYALKSRAVQGVVRVATLTRVPRAPAAVAGVFSRRGVVYVGLDTARVLGWGERGSGGSFAVTLADVPYHCALMVDDVTGTSYVARGDIREGALEAIAFAGVTEDRRIVLDPAALWREVAGSLGLGT